MTKKINTKLVKLIKYYSLINHNLIYENEAINRYKINKNLTVKGPKGKDLQELKDVITKIKNCELKKSSTNIVFSDGNPNAKIMIIGEGPGANEDLEGVPFIGRTGELLDKISILEIKLEKVKDKDRQKRIKNEYDILKKVQNSSIEMSDKIKDLYRSVSNVNIKLWDIEDKIRICEQNKDFGKNFIELARGVYFNNDNRAKLKNEINEILKSNIREIKQFVDYFKI